MITRLTHVGRTCNTLTTNRKGNGMKIQKILKSSSLDLNRKGHRLYIRFANCVFFDHYSCFKALLGSWQMLIIDDLSEE